MRFFDPPSFTNAWEDRSPTNATLGAVAALQSDSGTERLAYTVPAGRRAYVGMVGLSLFVATVGAAGTFARLNLNVTPNGGALEQLGMVNLEADALASSEAAHCNVNLFLVAGDKIHVNSLQADATAVVTAIMGVAITEFEA